MTEPWRKLGLVLEATGEPLSRSHAMLPTPYVMPGRVRVFFASCDASMRGRVFFADFEPQPPFRPIGRPRGPVLDVGLPGAFDCDGANPSQAFEIGGRLALLYIGWRRGPPDEPYTLFGAVAFSDDQGESFERATTPLLPPLDGERLFRTAPFIEGKPGDYRLLYIGGDAFISAEDGRRLPVYRLMELRSPTPWGWNAAPKVLMSPDLSAGEVGFGRPLTFVAPDGARRLMLSVRTRGGYRLVETLGDFDASERPTLVNVIPEPLANWEREMTCFGAPCVVNGHELLFYNGNGYGRSGIGLAWRPAAASRRFDS